MQKHSILLKLSSCLNISFLYLSYSLFVKIRQSNARKFSPMHCTQRTLALLSFYIISSFFVAICWRVVEILKIRVTRVLVTKKWLNIEQNCLIICYNRNGPLSPLINILRNMNTQICKHHKAEAQSKREEIIKQLFTVKNKW